MPYICVKTSRVLTQEEKQQLVEGCGKAIYCLSGKNSAGLMTEIVSGAELYMGSNRMENGAYIELNFFGKAVNEELDALNAALFAVLAELGIRADDVYITYKPLSHWGVKGFCPHLS